MNIKQEGQYATHIAPLAGKNAYLLYTIHSFMSNEQKKFFHMSAHIPVFFIGVLLVGFCVYWFYPLYFLGMMSLPVTNALGIVFLITGTVIVIAAERSRKPFFKLLHVQTCYDFAVGLYRYSRHPGMIGFTTMYVGIACILNSLSMLLVGLVSFVILSQIIVPPYERTMVTLCASYDDYRKIVRKWL